MFNRARVRLTLWFAGAFAAIIVVIGLAVMFSARTALYDQVEDDLRGRAEPILSSFRQEQFAPSRAAAIQFGTSGGYIFSITGPRGNTVVASAGIEDIELPTIEDLEGVVSTEGLRPRDNRIGYTEVKTINGEDLKLYVQPVIGNDGNIYFFQVGRSIEPEQEAIRRLVFILIAGGLAGLVMSGAGGYWLAGRALSPIKASVEKQREFVADASHELRTPLALIRANAEILQRAGSEPVDMTSVADIIKESDRLSYLVGQMLTLARSDTHDLKLDMEPVHLGRMAEDMGRQMQLLANEKNISVKVDAAADTIVGGDEQRLGELLIILLDNAIKYTDDGGSVTVSVAPTDGQVRLEVADTGRGIAADALPRVFDRFYRADKARSREMGGTGLGLAIAKWIVDTHGGTIELDSEAGHGTTVTVVLPVAGMTAVEETNAAVVDAVPEVVGPEVAPDAPEAGA